MDEKLEAQTAQLAAIDHATLTPLVQSALGSKTVEVANWEFEQLHGGIGAGTAVYRFSGQGRDQHQTIPWSLILKMLQSEGGSADASAWNYYRREVDAYQSGWTADLPGGLAAPRCFGVLDHLDGTCWMWLEEVAEEVGSQWGSRTFGICLLRSGPWSTITLSPVTWASSTVHTWWTDPCRVGRGSVPTGCGTMSSNPPPQ